MPQQRIRAAARAARVPRLRRGLRDARRPPCARAARRQRGVLRRRRVRTRAVSSQCEILHTTTPHPPPPRTASVGSPPSHGAAR